MSKRILIMSILLLFVQLTRAQEKLNYAQVDNQSYQLFQEKNWTELIRYSSEARKQGIDFFYLQARTGIAWYNLGKYRTASEWFLKAYEADRTPDWLQEYVYYSLVYSGRGLEAIKYAPRFSDSSKEKIGFQEIAITRLAYEAGYSFNSDFNQIKSRDFGNEINLGEDYGENYLLKNYTFHSFDLSHRVAPNLTLNHNLTYVGVNREAIVDWGVKTNSAIRINQFNYYLNPVWVIGKKLNISPSLSLIFGNGDVYAGSLNNNSAKTYRISKTTYGDVVLSTAVWSNFKNLSPGIELNAGNINDTKFTQLSAWLTYYPFSNAKFYLTPIVYFISATGTSGLNNNAYGISGGVQLGKLHFNGKYLTGEMENFVESNGYLVSNFAGKVSSKIMGSVYFPLNKRYQFVFRYISQNMAENYQVYTSGYKSKSLEYNYTNQTITGGISWNF